MPLLMWFLRWFHLGVKEEPLAPTKPSRVTPFPLSPQLPVPVIGKEDDETEGYGVACDVGVLNPPENRNRTDWFFELLKFPLLPPAQPPLRKLRKLKI
jgi:hypothetical protein